MFKIGDAVKVYEGDELIRKYRGTIIDKLNDSLTIKTDDGNEIVVDVKQLRRDYQYISPSALNLFENNREEFYYRYIARYSAPSMPQTEPMAIGSSFDAHVKHELMNALNHSKKPNLVDLFNSQVEEQNRNLVWDGGLHCLDMYKRTGAYTDLLLEMANGMKEPVFEFDLKGSVKSNVGDIKIGGKPDLYFINSHGCHVILDFKVNGYYSKRPVSPKPHYNVLRDSYNQRKYYKDAITKNYKGIELNIAVKLETINIDWATQLTMYAWMSGCEDFICAIEQLCCSPSGEVRPEIKVASFRTMVGKDFQAQLVKRLEICHKALNGHFFSELSLAESEAKCLELERMSQMMRSNVGDNKETWFDNLGRER